MSHYITLISPDGGGKDTVFNRIITDYEDAVRMYEPGGTEEADIIRHVLLDAQITKEERINLLKNLLNTNGLTTVCKEYVEKAIVILSKEGLNGEAEAYLYAASRAETNQKVIIPSMQNGKLILGRRSVACSMSYQGYARGLGMPNIWNINQKAMYGAYPSLEIYLDVPADVAQERLKGRSEKQDRLDGESMDFHRLTVEGYHRYYKEYCPYLYTVVDGTQSKEGLYQEVKGIIEKHLSRNNPSNLQFN